MSSVTFALLAGIAYLGAGVMGLIPLFLVPPPADAPATHFTVLYGYLLGLFPVNVLHSAVHIVIGLWGLSAAMGSASSVMFARSLAVLFGVLAVMGLFPATDTLFGLMPLDGHDVWLHGLTALAAAYFGWRVPAMAHDRRAATDRRQMRVPVAHDRRTRPADRRRGYEMHPA